jgi:hypothetical protein
MVASGDPVFTERLRRSPRRSGVLDVVSFVARMAASRRGLSRPGPR